MARALAIAAATLLVYSNTFDASFHFDDARVVVGNEALRDLSGFWPPSGNRYLGYLSFALNYRLGGVAVWSYHLANLLIHVSNALLVCWLAAITLRTPALRRAELGPFARRRLPLLAGVVFALHPIATQAVTYVSQRFTSLATLFFLLSLALHARARLSLEGERSSRLRTAGLYAASFVAAIAAMRTKEISFTLPFVALGYELLFFGPGRRLLLAVPLAMTAALVPAGLASRGQDLSDVLGEASRFAAETQDIPRSAYLLTEARVVVRYLRLLLVPVGQNLDHDVPLSRSLADPYALAAIAILAAVAALAVLALVRARKVNRAAGQLAFFGIAWFFVTLSVESSIIPIRDVMFEHRVYLPSVGTAIAMAAAVLAGIERLRLRIAPRAQVAVALLAVGAPLGGATYARNLVWKDERTLWSDAVAKSPGKARPHNNLGTAFQLEGRLDDAIREYREAIRIAPRYDHAHANLAMAYQAGGRPDDAVREYAEAIRLNPALAEAHNGLGAVYHEAGQLDRAVDEYREAIHLAPGLVDAHLNLGNALKATARSEDALREYLEAVRLDPSNADARAALDAAVREAPAARKRAR